MQPHDRQQTVYCPTNVSAQTHLDNYSPEYQGSPERPCHCIAWHCLMRGISRVSGESSWVTEALMKLLCGLSFVPALHSCSLSSLGKNLQEQDGSPPRTDAHEIAPLCTDLQRIMNANELCLWEEAIPFTQLPLPLLLDYILP